MRVRLQTPTLRRMIFASCCGATNSPMTQAQKDALLSRLLDRTWSPTPDDTPVPFAMVQAWVDAQQGALPRLPEYSSSRTRTRRQPW